MAHINNGFKTEVVLIIMVIIVSITIMNRWDRRRPACMNDDGDALWEDYNFSSKLSLLKKVIIRIAGFQ